MSGRRAEDGEIKTTTIIVTHSVIIQNNRAKINLTIELFAGKLTFVRPVSSRFKHSTPLYTKCLH